MSEIRAERFRKRMIDNGWLQPPRTLTVDGIDRGSTHGNSVTSITKGTGLKRQGATPRDLRDVTFLAPDGSSAQNESINKAEKDN